MRIQNIIILSVIVIAACSRHQSLTYTDEQEGELFQMVSEAGAIGKYDRTVYLADSVCSLEGISPELRAYVMIEKGVALHNGGDIDRSASFADTLTIYGRKYGFSEAEEQGLMLQGLALKRQGNYEKAIPLFQEGLNLSVENGDRDMEQSFLDMLAVIYTELKRPECLDYAQKSLEAALGADDQVAVAQARASVGEAMVATGDYAGAIDSLKPYIPEASLTVPSVFVKFLTPMIKASLALDSLDLADNLIAQGMVSSESLPLQHQARVAMLNAKANLLGKRKDFASKLSILKQIDNIGHFGKPQYVVEIEFADCFAALGMTDSATMRYQMAYKAFEADKKSEISEQLSELTVRYETLKKEGEIANLRQQRYLYIIIALIAVALALAMVLLLFRLQAKAKMRSIQRYIDGIENERKRIALELHDEIGSRMVAINLSGDKRLPVVLAEVMDTLHSLRQQSHRFAAPDFNRIGLPEALQSLKDQYSQMAEAVSFSFEDTSTANFSEISTEISFQLYRIAQEAVNNALKHGNPSEITIKLTGSSEDLSLCVANNNSSLTDATIAVSGTKFTSIRNRASIIGARFTASVHNGVFEQTVSL